MKCLVGNFGQHFNICSRLSSDSEFCAGCFKRFGVYLRRWKSSYWTGPRRQAKGIQIDGPYSRIYGYTGIWPFQSDFGQ